MKELTLPLEEEILQMPEVRIAAMRLGGSRVPINEAISMSSLFLRLTEIAV